MVDNDDEDDDDDDGDGDDNKETCVEKRFSM